MVTGLIIGAAALGLFGLVTAFGDRYECSPEEVQEACDELSNISNKSIQAISDEIGKNVTIINNATSGYVDVTNMNTYAPLVQESITNLISVLDKQAQMIEDYNNGTVVEKMMGTGTMAILNLTEGLAKFTEDIVDAGANILSGVGTFCGFDMEAVELWAAKDHVGEFFDDAFENGALNWVEKYSIYSHESTAAEIFKGIGTTIPYIALAATGVGIAVEAGVAGAAGFGRGSTNYQQEHLVYDANGEASFDDTYSTGSMMWEGTKQGVLDAATTVLMDKGFKAIGKGISKLKAGKAAEKAVAESAEAGAKKALTEGAEAVAESADDFARTGEKALVKNTDNLAEAGEKAASNASGKTARELTEELDELNKLRNTMPEAEFAKARKSIIEQLKKVHPDVLEGQAAREATEQTVKQVTEKTTRETVEQVTEKATGKAVEQVTEKTTGKAVEQVTEKTTGKAVEQVTEKTTRETVEQVTGQAAGGGSKLKNGFSTIKDKAKSFFSGNSSTSSASGPRLGETTATKLTQAYDNAVAGAKNLGGKVGNAAKSVVTDTAKFVAENPKSAIIGGGIIAGEKAIGNIKTSYIPTDLATDGIKTMAGDGVSRITIDDVDDIAINNANTSGNTTSSGGTSSGGSTTSSGGTSSGGSTTSSGSTSSGGNTNSAGNTKTDEKTKTDEISTKDNKEEKTEETNKKENEILDEKQDNTTSEENNKETSVINNESNNTTNTTQGSSGISHAGTTSSNSGYSNNNNTNYNSGNNNTTSIPETIEETTELEPEIPIEETTELEPSEEIEEESVYTIPSNLSGVTETKKKSSGSGVLPVLGGLGAAAAVGVGAKMYLNNKKNNENGDDEEEEYLEDNEFDNSENGDLLADEWNGEDTESNPYGDTSESEFVTPEDEDLGEM